MKRSLALFMLLAIRAFAADQPDYPYFRSDAAAEHAIQPHRTMFHVDGTRSGSDTFPLRLIVSPAGGVLEAGIRKDVEGKEFWPRIHAEIMQWKYTPFEKDGKAVTAQVEEYISLLPPERLPDRHILPPDLKPDSDIEIELQRGGCYGNCPGYSVRLHPGSVVFDGYGYVVAPGRHTGYVDPEEVRRLASRFISADFFSLDEEYHANATDSAGYALSIKIDGRSKQVSDYLGLWVGMPEVISELEDAVDDLAGARRWVTGGTGLVAALNGEKFNFQAFEAQVILKGAAQRGSLQTVRELLQAGVSLKPAPPKPKDKNAIPLFAGVGWLNAAGGNTGVLRILIAAGASKRDQHDKDLGLMAAVRAGNLPSVRALLAYGADANADLTRLTVTEESGGMTLAGPGHGNILYYAAESGNPAVVREILSYRPDVRKRGADGKTAMFAAVDWKGGDEDGARVEIVRLLATAGADINAADKDGNTPLHETFLTDVAEELLNLGARVNARNNDGETPVFTTVDEECLTLYIRRGANLKIRNKKGETVFEVVGRSGPGLKEALRQATQN